MVYRQMGNSDVELSVIGLGGHEYLVDGRSRGFNEGGNAENDNNSAVIMERTMPIIKFGIIGSGWRCLFFMRIVKEYPDRFNCAGVVETISYLVIRRVVIQN